MAKIQTRYGDGYRLEMTSAEVRRDLEAGSRDAAERAHIEPLTGDEFELLFDIFKRTDRIVGVESGREVCLTYDGQATKIKRAHIIISKIQSLQVFERALGADSLELTHIDYSFKPVKPIVPFEKPVLERALMVTTAPLFYGAMPNLGAYTYPDGPCPNPADLLPLGKIKEARAAYEESIEFAVKDMVYVGSEMIGSGADGINFDTVGAAGEGDFLAALRAVEILKEKYPGMGIEMGMAGEFVLGLHGELAHNGVRLAGLYPHQQVELAQNAGVSIFGPAININTSQTLPWNLARSVTFIKACSEVARIPIHANLGMGVCGIPLTPTPPVDALSRAAKAHVEICRLDGL